MPFLELRTVCTFKIEDFEINEFDLPRPIPKFAAKTLALSSTNLRPEDLRSFLQCFPSLERLRIGYSHGTLSPSNLAFILEPLKHSLKELRVFEEASAPTVSSSGRTAMAQHFLALRPTSSLTGFKELKIIDTITCNLIGLQGNTSSAILPLSKVLPRALVKLTLRNCFNETARHLLSLLGDGELRNMFPYLEEVRMVFKYGFIDPDIAEWEKDINLREEDEARLREEGERRGVRVVVQEDRRASLFHFYP